MESTKKQSTEDLGLSERTKFDVQKSPRNETNEQEQRPVVAKETLTDHRGSFQTK